MSSYTPDRRYWADQRFFDNLHWQLTIDSNYSISREKYVEEVNMSWYEIDPKYKPDLQRRKDKRSLGEFALFIYDTTIREQFLIREWLKMAGKEYMQLKDKGICNKGRLILDPQKKNGQVDYLLVTEDGGEIPLEVKFCPCQYKLTFKVVDLKSYKNQNALVLLIMGETRMIGPNGDPNSDKQLVIPPGLKWCLFGRDTIKALLEKIPIRLHKEVGYKPSVQLRTAEINRFLKVRDWHYVESIHQLDGRTTS